MSGVNSKIKTARERIEENLQNQGFEKTQDGGYQRILKGKKGKQGKIQTVSSKDLESFQSDKAVQDKIKKRAKMSTLVDEVQKVKSSDIDGKFGPGTYQNLPWGKVNATMLVEQQKTTTKTNITIEMSLESSKNDPTTELPVVDSQKEIEPLPIITGTTKLHSEGMYALNQRDKLNILIAREQTPSPFKGLTPAEFINDLVDLKNYWLVGRDSPVPKLVGKGLNIWGEDGKKFWDMET